jgi:transcription elongation factor
MTQRILLAGGLVIALVACTEAPQNGSAKTVGAPAWQGSTNPAYVEPGWKAGDRQAWETHLDQRIKGQNEYQRIGGAS